MTADPRRTRTVVGLLVLASITIATLDARRVTDGSPVDPLRSAVAAVLGPAEDGATQAFAPLTDLLDRFGSAEALIQRNESLQRANDQLTWQLRVAGAEETRATEASGISLLADTSGFDVVQAQVIAMGSAQFFSRTVTIDVGTSSGVTPDLTVINADGLVGRVLQAGSTTATVLLVVDTKSTVGGRLGESMELGFLEGNGRISEEGSLELSLVDHTVAPSVGDTVLTWGSRNDAPYVAGVPIGQVVGVHSSPAELTETARIDPFVDFSTLDMVGVVVGGSGAGNLVAGGAR